VALASGRWTLDWWEGQTPAPYFVRPAIKGHEGRLFHLGCGGECTFLGPGGCELRRHPLQCRLLRPGGDCVYDHDRWQSKLTYARLWRDWWPVFCDLRRVHED